MKQVLSIQDLSCLGKCSLTVALPVLSAMGCTCTPLPTAVLSTHTAFPQPHVRSLTGDILPICRHWQSIGARFDAISIGYLSDPEQAAAVESVLDTFHTLKILDPVMGDNGTLYRGIGPDHQNAMTQLCHKANYLLPNVTEAALLTNTPYRETADRQYYTGLLEKLMDFGAEATVITGASLHPGMTGFMGMDASGLFSYETQQLPIRCHGTGDLFTAVFTGALVNGENARVAATKAAAFVEKVLLATPAATPFGPAFEAQLSHLWKDT